AGRTARGIHVHASLVCHILSLGRIGTTFQCTVLPCIREGAKLPKVPVCRGPASTRPVRWPAGRAFQCRRAGQVGVRNAEQRLPIDGAACICSCNWTAYTAYSNWTSSAWNCYASPGTRASPCGLHVFSP